MSFLVYFFVLLVAASSVLFGLDWMQAPLLPPVKPAPVATAPQVPPIAAQAAADTKAVPRAAQATVAAAPHDASMAVTPEALPSAVSPDPPKVEASAPKPAPLCDIAACERAYRTFTPADCTYKPSEGARRLCTKGNPPRRPAALLAVNEAHAQAGCNVSACGSAYQSFDAATCTYQPYGGPRRLCTK